MSSSPPQSSQKSKYLSRKKRRKKNNEKFSIYLESTFFIVRTMCVRRGTMATNRLWFLTENTDLLTRWTREIIFCVVDIFSFFLSVTHRWWHRHSYSFFIYMHIHIHLYIYNLHYIVHTLRTSYRQLRFTHFTLSSALFFVVFFSDWTVLFV